MGLDYSYSGGSSSGGSTLGGYDFAAPSGSFKSPSFGSGGGATSTLAAPLVAPSAPASAARPAPEKLDFNQYFGSVFADRPDSLTGPAGSDPASNIGDFISNLGMVPARVQEMPLSVANVATGSNRSTNQVNVTENGTTHLGTLSKGSLGLVDAAALALKGTPIGDLVGGISNVIQEGSRVPASYVNEQDLKALDALKNVPDSYDFDPRTAKQYGLNIGQMVPISFRYQTVGDFRKEMAARGFTPAEIAAFSAGTKSSWDLRSHPGNSNPLLELAASFIGNPINAVLPGLGFKGAYDAGSVAGQAALKGVDILKPVTSGIGLADRMAQAGFLAKAAPDAITAARGIEAGDASLVTSKGVATYIANALARPDKLVKAYTFGSTALSGGIAALNQTTDWAINNLPKDTPFEPIFQGLHDWSSAVLNDHPLSNSALFDYFAAFHYPIRDAAGPLKSFINDANLKIKGSPAEQFLSSMANALGTGDTLAERKQSYLDGIGGYEGHLQLLGHLGDSLMKGQVEHGLHPRFDPAYADSILKTNDPPSAREAQYHNAIHDARDRQLLSGQMGASQLTAEFKRQFGLQSGYEKTGVKQVFDPETAMSRWADWTNVMQTVGRPLWERASQVVGLANTLTKENITDLKAVLRAGKEGDVVPLDVVRAAQDTYPQWVSNHPQFARFGVQDAVAPSWDTLRRQLTDLAKDAPTQAETYHELTSQELQAPAPVEVPPAPDAAAHREVTPAIARDVIGSAPRSPDVQSALDQMRAIRETQANAADFTRRSSLAAQLEKNVEDITSGKLKKDPLTGDAISEATRSDVIASLQARIDRLDAPITTETAAGTTQFGDIGERPPTMAEADPIRAANDGSQGFTSDQIQQNLAHDAVATDVTRSGTGIDANAPTATTNEINAQLRAAGYPGYIVKEAPDLATILREAEVTNPKIGAQMTRLNGIYETLRYQSPLTPLGNALSWLLDPVANNTFRDGQMQAIMSRATPLGALPSDITRTIAELRNQADLEAHSFRGLRITPKWDALSPNKIDDIAAKNLPPDVTARIVNEYGSFTHLIDQAGNRFIRSLHEANLTNDALSGAKGLASDITSHGAAGAVVGRLEKALEGWYGDYQQTPLGAVTRTVKQFYPIIRFVLSPRFWAMNALEINILGMTKYGSGYQDEALSGYMHRNGALPREKLIDETSQANTFNEPAITVVGRKWQGYLQSALSSMRPEAVQQVIDSLPRGGVEFQGLVRRFGANEGTWSEQLGRDAASIDALGVKGALNSEAQKFLTQQQIADLGPVMQRLYEVNQGHYDAMVNLFEGNPSRTNLERVLNSYFLYWPLSYQLKAGKWIFDVATERAFGKKSNFAGAYTYHVLQQQHKNLLVNDPAYASMFSDHPELWFAAQMLLPISPGDIGVSLSRGPRYAISALGHAIEGTPQSKPLGWWGDYQAASSPVTFISALANLGPIYDIGLLTSIYNQSKKSGDIPWDQPAAKPAPAAPPIRSVPLGPQSTGLIAQPSP